jgi:hypothetical protein
MARGGYRKPERPAPVSGPGALSRRTDGGPSQPVRELPDARYGEAKTFREVQQGAPVAGQPQTPAPQPAGAMQQLLQQMVPLGAPTARPDEPITAGASTGPGVGPEALGLPSPESVNNEDLQMLQRYLPALVFQANQPGASASFRNWVRQIRASL